MAQRLPVQISDYIAQLESQDPAALVAAFDRYGFYLYATPNHEPVIGYSAADLLTMNLTQVINQPEHHAAWVLRTISVLYSKPIPFSTKLVAKPGHLVRISGTLRHISVPEGGMYFVSSVKVMASASDSGKIRE
jgi:hypothetical protein